MVNFGHLPPRPSDEEITLIESRQLACKVLMRRLRRGHRNDFILHDALEAGCPLVFIQSLVQIFPNQVQQVYMIDGRYPLHIALQSGLGGSVRLLADKFKANALLRANPGYLEYVV